jgi:hypothetical protein
MTVFREAPLSLEFNDLVVVKIYATNQIGSSPECDENTDGVRI